MSGPCPSQFWSLARPAVIFVRHFQQHGGNAFLLVKSSASGLVAAKSKHYAVQFGCTNLCRKCRFSMYSADRSKFNIFYRKIIRNDGVEYYCCSPGLAVPESLFSTLQMLVLVLECRFADFRSEPLLRHNNTAPCVPVSVAASSAGCAVILHCTASGARVFRKYTFSPVFHGFQRFCVLLCLFTASCNSTRLA